MNQLLPMDYRALAWLVQEGGRLTSEAIPLRLFHGEMPEGHPNLVQLGMIQHDGDFIVITELGRASLERIAA